jgi:hypothetical protein
MSLNPRDSWLNFIQDFLVGISQLKLVPTKSSEHVIIGQPFFHMCIKWLGFPVVLVVHRDAKSSNLTSSTITSRRPFSVVGA